MPRMDGIEAVKSASQEAHADVPQLIGDATMRQQKNILIVDDDPELVEVLAECCRHIGLFPRTAHNTLTALARIEERLPDLVCVDVMMPTGDGLMLCEMLSSTFQKLGIPIIVLTGRKDPEIVLSCRDLCANYVHKSGDVWSRIEPVIYELMDIESINGELVQCCR
ncbi:MAG: response regulator [Planctomycetia bacterium]|nr:response regulator [Planctomycetia bacterium]